MGSFMPDESTTILRFEEKLLLLVKKSQQLQQEKLDLEQRVEKLKKELEQRHLAVAEMENRLKNLRIAQVAGKGPSELEEKKLLRKQISDYIGEIDRCIALLNG
ncbi:MAG: hypothetical protein ACYCOO_04575 [Chitinophagaceae bacterium]